MFRWLGRLLALRAQQMHDLEVRVKCCEDDCAHMEAKLERLRGRFYATRPTPTGPPAPAPGSRAEKDAILREFHARRQPLVAIGAPHGELSADEPAT